MTHIYNVSGMTCSGCEAKVRFQLSKVEGVNAVQVDLEKGEAIVESDNHLPIDILRAALKDDPKYLLTEAGANIPTPGSVEPETKSWLATYKPIALIFGYIFAVALIAAFSGGSLDIMLGMRVFMAGFFLIFSFFKMLDLKAFAGSYAMYDVVARKFPAWGYIYGFAELLLGLAYAADFQPHWVNIVNLIIMSVSIIGVIQSVLNKKQIQCACLGTVFKLPMSTVTIIEDGLMIAMSGAMLWMLG